MAKKIYIDAGHGGIQPGACNGKRKESDDVLRMSLKVAEYLKGQNCEVKLSRTTDVDISINKRCEEANKWGADYFLSIHRNSGVASATGNEIWVYSKANADTMAKAKAILNGVCKADGLKNRGVKKGAAAYTDYGVNRLTKMPSALLEQGFISNASDNKAYDKYFDDIALEIAKGLLSAVGESYKAKVIKGDVDGDGKVTAADSRLALRASVGLEKLSDQQKKAADIDNDGKITAADSREILKMATGSSASGSYLVKITCDALNIRKGPSTEYAITGVIKDKNSYTIVQESNGWGKLKSGVGWISLKYTKKV